MTDFNDMIERLANIREKETEAKRAYDAALERHPEIAQLEKAMKTIKDASKELENEVREAARKHFESSTEKPHEAIGVRNSVTYIYDEALALEWSKAQCPLFLKLDTGAFEKFLKAQIVDTLPFPVNQTDTATPTISKDLSAYLAPKQAEEN